MFILVVDRKQHVYLFIYFYSYSTIFNGGCCNFNNKFSYINISYNQWYAPSISPLYILMVIKENSGSTSINKSMKVVKSSSSIFQVMEFVFICLSTDWMIIVIYFWVLVYIKVYKSWTISYIHPTQSWYIPSGSSHGSPISLKMTKILCAAKNSATESCLFPKYYSLYFLRIYVLKVQHKWEIIVTQSRIMS